MQNINQLEITKVRNENPSVGGRATFPSYYRPTELPLWPVHVHHQTHVLEKDPKLQPVKTLQVVLNKNIKVLKTFCRLELSNSSHDTSRSRWRWSRGRFGSMWEMLCCEVKESMTNPAWSRSQKTRSLPHHDLCFLKSLDVIDLHEGEYTDMLHNHSSVFTSSSLTTNHLHFAL